MSGHWYYRLHGDNSSLGGHIGTNGGHNGTIALQKIVETIQTKTEITFGP
jgi:hypothetical protein